jgi:hypothetical protein
MMMKYSELVQMIKNDSKNWIKPTFSLESLSHALSEAKRLNTPVTFSTSVDHREAVYQINPDESIKLIQPYILHSQSSMY